MRIPACFRTIASRSKHSLKHKRFVWLSFSGVALIVFVLVILASNSGTRLTSLTSKGQPPSTKDRATAVKNQKDGSAVSGSTTSAEDTKTTTSQTASMNQGQQSDPDKPPIPKTVKSLTISPSSITIYKNNGASNVKGNIDQVALVISNSDGKAMYEPNADLSEGVTVTATLFDTQPAWNMTASANYASIGTVNVPIQATAVDGSTSYSGTLHVMVLPMPSFSVSTSQLYGSGPPDSTNFDCGGLSPIAYSSGFDGSYTPTISVTAPAGYSFTSLGFSDFGFQLVSAAPISWGQTININIIVQNQFQLYSIPCQIKTST